MARRKGNLFSSGKRRGKRRDYRNASIGPNMGGYDAHGNTHTARSVKKTRPAHAPADQAGSRRAYKPGEIGYVRPQTATGESVSDYTRRAQRRARSMRPPLDVPIRSIVMVLVLAVVAIAIAAGVASCVFQGSVNSRMALQDASVAEALVAPESADAPYYVLLEGDDDAPAADGQADADILMLVRVDAAAGSATIVSIPEDLVCTLSDGSNGLVGAEPSVGGDAGLVKVVSSFAGVDIAHFAKLDAAGFVQLVDALGGIEVALPEEVDDPEAGSIYVPAGTQVLDGSQALVVSRAKNYLNSYDVRAQNQMRILVALARKAASGEGFGAQQGTLDAIAGTFQTDYSTGDLLRLLGVLGGIPDEAVQMARVPGYYGYEGGGLRFSVAPNGWKMMMEKVDAGGNPNEKSEAVQAVEPSKYTLTVKNGAGVAGAASECADALEALGYKVKETGNTDQFAYNETLVVYQDSKDAAAAEAIADALGVGRPVEAGIYYDFNTDLMVIVGQDWRPRS